MKLIFVCIHKNSTLTFILINARICRKNFYMRRIIAVVLSIIVAVSVCSCSTKNQENTVKAKLVVNCMEVIDNLNNETYAIKQEKVDIVPENGVVFDSDVDYVPGTNAFDLLIEILKNNKIQFEAKDGYVRAIGNIYEGDCGKFSGWMFYINGNLSDVGATDYEVSENDIIEFKYVVDYMKLFE